MINQVDHYLKEWIERTLGEIDVELAPPGATGKENAIRLHLMEMSYAPPAGNGRAPAPLRIWLRYLVTAWAPAAEEAHRLLGELLFAAVNSPRWEVQLEPPPDALWSACGVAPQPCFLLRTVFSRELPRLETKKVLEPIVIHFEPMEVS